MGVVSNILGAGSNKYKAHAAPVLQSPDLVNQITQAQQGASNIGGQQQSFADALRGYAGNSAGIDFGAANGTLAQGDTLLGQLMAQGQGQGPNPALEQLKQTTGQNIQQAAGMIASQRGVNPAMAARLAAQTGANMNQQAVGQAAIQSAQQQLASQQQAASLMSQLAQQRAAQSQAQAQNQQGWNEMYGGLLGQMGNQNLGQQQLLQGSLANFNNAKVGAVNGANQINADVAKQNSQFGQQLTGGLLNGAGSALSLLNKGGAVGCYADGGPVTSGVQGAPPKQLTAQGPSSQLGKMAAFSSGLGQVFAPPPSGQPAATDNGVAQGASRMGQGLANLASIGLKALIGASHGGQAFMSDGGVPGQSKVDGDSPRNDTVPALLSPGEIVIPRSHATPEGAKSFVEQLVRRSGGSGGYEAIVKARGR